MTDNAGRTIHGIPAYARRQALAPRLEIAGLVEAPLTVGADELATLPRTRYLDLPRDHPGNQMPATNWSGVLLADLVALARPQPGARFVLAGSGPYTVAIPLHGDPVLLCDRLDDQPLAAEQGGPWRLAGVNSRYFTSVKWLDRLMLTAEEPEASVERIIEGRRRARQARSNRPIG